MKCQALLAISIGRNQCVPFVAIVGVYGRGARDGQDAVVCIHMATMKNTGTVFSKWALEFFSIPNMQVIIRAQAELTVKPHAVVVAHHKAAFAHQLPGVFFAYPEAADTTNIHLPVGGDGYGGQLMVGRKITLMPALAIVAPHITAATDGV